MTGRGKRLFDVTLATLLGFASTPLLAICALLVRAFLGSPMFFCQVRTGRQGRLFTLYKFRTMQPSVEGEPDETRLTRIGVFLRNFSLDELPQLWNVLRGDMSLVGPRPLLPVYLERYTPEQARRHEVLPGITGLTQVSGRNGLSWPEKFALDVWYVDHRSLLLDLWIIWRTVVTVVRRRAISAPGSATMPEFLGEGGRGQ